jgi:L-rhamnose-H+ transport protein
MSVTVLFAIGLLMIAGVMMACSVVPMKYATKWRWENIWLLYVVFGQVVFPVILVALTAPDAWEVFGVARKSALASALLFGLGWGVGNVLAGIGYTMLGVGLGLSVNLGLTASAGSLIPLAVLFPARLISSSAVALYAGVGTMLGGLILSAHAGRLRQAHQAPDQITSGADVKAFGRGNIRTGLIVCVAAGFLSSMLNLSFAFGDNVRVTALRLGASAPAAVNTLWLPILISGFLPTLFYCAFLLSKNKSWSAFVAPGVGSHWWIAILMGLLFLGALSVYGIASVRLGAMGPVLGFPIFMSTIVLTGNTAGILTGEWKGAPKNSYFFMFSGMLLLILSIVIIGIGNSRVG